MAEINHEHVDEAHRMGFLDEVQVTLALNIGIDIREAIEKLTEAIDRNTDERKNS